MGKNRKKIGEIFVENGTITETTLQRALERAARIHIRLGDILEDMGVVTGEEIAQALARQFGFRRVNNLDKYVLTSDLLNLFSAEIAFRYMLFPLKIKNNKLYIAIADPTDTRIIANISANHRMEVIPLVATRAEIIAAINKNYLGKNPLVSGRKTVLVAEDSDETCKELESLLAGNGYRVICARDGIEAFKLTLSESPTVVITSKELPKLGGYSLHEAIKCLPEAKSIPVILLDDSTNVEEEAIAHRHGFFEFVAKPINRVSLLTRVKKAVTAYEKSRYYL